MKLSNIKKAVVIFLHAFFGTLICYAIMIYGNTITSAANAVTFQLISIPVVYSTVAFIYFQQFHFTTPLSTAITFTVLTIVLKALIFIPFFEKSYPSLASMLNSWPNSVLIFASVYLTGNYVKTK